MPNDPITSVLLSMPLTLPVDPLDPAEIEEAFALADERHEIVDVLGCPEGIFPIEIAGYARDLLDAVLEAAGFTCAVTEEDDPNIRVLSPADMRVLLEELPPDDLLTLARGGDLPADHPYLRKVRGEAA